MNFDSFKKLSTDLVFKDLKHQRTLKFYKLQNKTICKEKNDFFLNLETILKNRDTRFGKVVNLSEHFWTSESI